jgi:glycosyltransferase involved in cell wall biosynthesis
MITKDISPAISIIIPVFNVESYLSDCLDSVVNQSLREIEIICINDGSVDNSLAILHDYAQRDDRIKIVDKPNEGQAVARNLALSFASGKYVVFVDSDDHIDLDLCLKAFEIAEKDHCDVLLYDHLTFNDVIEIPLKKNMLSALTTMSASDRNAILSGMGVVWTKFVRTDFIRTYQISFPEGLIYEDILVHWKFVTLAKRIAILPERLYHYRVQPSATTQRSDWRLSEWITVLDFVREFLISRHFYETYRDLFLKSQMECFCTVYDYIDSAHKGKIMTLIEERLNSEHWDYVDSQKPLHWRTRDFFRVISGSTIAKIRRDLWFFARSCYRGLI